MSKHPMGAAVPGRYFVFVEADKHVTYHALVIDANSPAEAKAKAATLHAEGAALVRTVGTVPGSVIFIVRPVREHHSAANQEEE